ncbi:MAG: hypothetical protein ABS81_08145 [Pseudonocardia sp. SCN 72-86]|nr:MAG: hypothetical protein ABS81_08145 [Pseudonocardia sp. SCN 72-86]
MLDPTGLLAAHTLHDWSRSYLLPDDVETNIPRNGRHRDCGAFNLARGLLVEVVGRTGGRPRTLTYTEWQARCGRGRGPRGGDSCAACTTPALISHTTVSAHIDLLERTRPLTVTVHYRFPLERVDGHQNWRISVDGVALPVENRVRPPSPLVIAGIVQRVVLETLEAAWTGPRAARPTGPSPESD